MAGWQRAIQPFELLSSFVLVTEVFCVFFQFRLQHIPGTVQPGTHGTDGDVEDFRNFFVSEIFHIGQQNHGTEVHCQLIDGHGDGSDHEFSFG